MSEWQENVSWKGQTLATLECRKQQTTERKHNFRILLESELINRDHRMNSKQKLQLHHKKG